MYKALKEGKIIAISDTDNEFKLMVKDGVIKDTKHTCEDYEQYNGEYLLKSKIPAPTEEEQRQARANAYLQEVDPITAHIERLRDEAEPDEVKIAELIAERSKKVEEIKQKFPYGE